MRQIRPDGAMSGSGRPAPYGVIGPPGSPRSQARSVSILAAYAFGFRSWLLSHRSDAEAFGTLRKQLTDGSTLSPRERAILVCA